MNFIHVCGSLSSAAQLDPSVPDRQFRACTSGPRSPEDETLLPSCLLASSWFLPLPPAHQMLSRGLCTCASPTGKPLSPGICLTPFLITWRTPLPVTLFKIEFFLILSFSMACITPSHALRFTHLVYFLPCQIWAPQRTRTFMMPVLW